MPIQTPQDWVSTSFCQTAFAKFTILCQLEGQRIHSSLKGAAGIGLSGKESHVPVALGPLVSHLPEALGTVLPLIDSQTVEG